MALKAVLDSLDGLPDILHEHYLKDDTSGKYVLAADGLVPKTKLDEFRNNNIELLRKQDEQNARFAGIDLEEYKALKTEKQKNAEKKLIDSGKVDELVESRVTEMRTTYESQLTAEKTSNSQLRTRLEVVLIDSELAKAAAEAGVVETAVDDIIWRGRQTFKLDNDKVVPKQGDQIMYGSDGVTPLSIKEWLSKLAVGAPHLFKASKGGGADGGSRNGGGGNTTVTKKSELKTPAEKAKFIQAHGKDVFLNLPA
jgi:hypothetical protein